MEKFEWMNVSLSDVFSEAQGESCSPWAMRRAWVVWNSLGERRTQPSAELSDSY